MDTSPEGMVGPERRVALPSVRPVARDVIDFAAHLDAIHAEICAASVGLSIVLTHAGAPPRSASTSAHRGDRRVIALAR